MGGLVIVGVVLLTRVQTWLSQAEPEWVALVLEALTKPNQTKPIINGYRLAGCWCKNPSSWYQFLCCFKMLRDECQKTNKSLQLKLSPADKSNLTTHQTFTIKNEIEIIYNSTLQNRFSVDHLNYKIIIHCMLVGLCQHITTNWLLIQCYGKCLY